MAMKGNGHSMKESGLPPCSCLLRHHHVWPGTNQHHRRAAGIQEEESRHQGGEELGSGRREELRSRRRGAGIREERSWDQGCQSRLLAAAGQLSRLTAPLLCCRRHSYRTGQDIANCGTCRDCACIIYRYETAPAPCPFPGDPCSPASRRLLLGLRDRATGRGCWGGTEGTCLCPSSVPVVARGCRVSLCPHLSHPWGTWH